MDRVSHFSSSFASPIGGWGGVVFLVLMLLVTTYKMLQKPSVIGGVGISLIILIMLFSILTHDEVTIDESGVGTIESKIYTFVGIKKYRYQGLSKAKALIMEDIGSEQEMIKNYLLFDEGYKLPLPNDKTICKEVTVWLKNKYNLDIAIIKIPDRSKKKNTH